MEKRKLQTEKREKNEMAERRGWEDNRGRFEVLEGQIRRLMKRIEGYENDGKREEDWRMARVDWLNEMDRRMWVGGFGRNERVMRKRKERRGERESSDEGSEDGKYESLEEKIRELVEIIEGSEGGPRKVEEKRRKKWSSSDEDGGHGKWKWDGEHWWYKVRYQATVNSRLRWRISRLVWVTLEQEVTRRRDGGHRLRSRIEWLEERKQQGTGQSKLRTSGDPASFQEREPGSSWEGQFM